jgi:hypothetical protein
MTAIRIVATADSEFVMVIDEATGMAEQVEMSTGAEIALVDTIIEEEPEVSGRYHYTP